jgi:hypothetical protein
LTVWGGYDKLFISIIGLWEALSKPKYTDWRADFSPDEGEKPQAYFVYVKVLKRNMAGNMPSRCVRRLIQRFPNKQKRGVPA